MKKIHVRQKVILRDKTVNQIIWIKDTMEDISYVKYVCETTDGPRI